MGTTQNITVTIAERPYRMSVKREEEEVVRAAVDRINQTISEYSKAFEYKDQQDLFAMVTLQYAADAIHLENEKSFKDTEMKQKLSEIDTALSDHLDSNNIVL